MVILAISLALLAYLGFGDFKEARETHNYKAMKYQRRSVFGIIIMLLVAYGLYHYQPYLVDTLAFIKKRQALIIASVFFSATISYLWFLFFRALDIFEKEKIGPLVVIFIMACCTLFLVFPIGNFLRSQGFALDGTFLGDLIYCIVVIGVPEELVKIIPFLLLLRFTRFIDEPYDYILYGGVCALGFAFVENIQYLYNSGMSALAGRALYSTVSHIFDTSLICYFMAIARYKGTHKIIALLKGFALAALAHGFYDFWVITESVSYPLLTIFFFLASIHVLVMMINNLINISPYYKPERLLRTAKYKFYLTTYLVAILLLGFIFMLFSRGQQWAIAFARGAAFFDSYVLMYLVVSFTSLNVVHGYIMPLRFKKMLLPLINRYPNYRGLKVKITAAQSSWKEQKMTLVKALPAEGYLRQRLVLNGNFNWYEIEQTLAEPPTYRLILAPLKFNYHLLNGQPQMCRLAILKASANDKLPLLGEEDIEDMTPGIMVALEPAVKS